MNETIIICKDSPAVQHLCKVDKRLAKAISMVGDISYSPLNNPYNFLIHEIIKQMLSVKAGQKIYSRLIELCSGKITPSSIDQLTINELKGIGTSTAKATYIKELTSSVLSGNIDLEKLEYLSDTDVIKSLTKLKGIGEWTSHMYLIFVLDRQDILPTTDVAFLQVYKWLYKTNDCSKLAVQKNAKNGNLILRLRRVIFINFLMEDTQKNLFIYINNNINQDHL